MSMHNLDPDVRRRLIEECKRGDVAQNWEMLREGAWKRLSETFGEINLSQYWEMSNPEGESPLKALARRQGRVDDAIDWSGIQIVPRGIPRQEVNLSRETMELLRDSLDATLEYYGTSGDLDPRGYWMPIDGDTR